MNHQTIHTPEVYDFRQYDRIWQRVAPTLEPYPSPEQTGAAAPVQAVPPAQTAAPAQAVPPAQTAAPVQAVPPAQTAAPAPGSAALTLRQEQRLPGAAPDPCCMGSAAAESLEVLAGFLEEELADRRQILALARQAPAWARQSLRDIAAGQAGHARQLIAAHYLITGDCLRPSISAERIYVGKWCPALRERYHAAACNGLNYARAAENTTDPCLRRMLSGLSGDSYRYAEDLMALLERSLQS